MAKEVISTLEPFAPKLDDKDKRIMELEQQLEASNKMPPANAETSNSEPAIKRRRLEGKQSLPILQQSSSIASEEDYVVQALYPQQVPQVRIFQTQPINGVTKTMVDKWIKSIKKNDKVKYDQTLASLTLGSEKVKELSSQTVSQLTDKLAQLGLPVQMATKLKAPEMIQCSSQQRIWQKSD